MRPHQPVQADLPHGLGVEYAPRLQAEYPAGTPTWAGTSVAAGPPALIAQRRGDAVHHVERRDPRVVAEPLEGRRRVDAKRQRSRGALVCWRHALRNQHLPTRKNSATLGARCQVVPHLFEAEDKARAELQSSSCATDSPTNRGRGPWRSTSTKARSPAPARRTGVVRRPGRPRRSNAGAANASGRILVALMAGARLREP